MATSARSSRPQSQGTATLPGMPSLRATSFQLVPRQRGQSSLAILPFEVRSPVRVFEGLPTKRRIGCKVFYAKSGGAEPLSLSSHDTSAFARGQRSRLRKTVDCGVPVLLFAIQFGKLFLQAAQFPQIVD